MGDAVWDDAVGDDAVGDDERKTTESLRAELARNARHQPRARRSDEDEPLGQVPLTPIERWLFERRLPRPETFTWTGLYRPRRRLEPGDSRQVLERALEQLQSSLDPGVGPVLRVGLVELGGPRGAALLAGPPRTRARAGRLRRPSPGLRRYG